MQRWWPNRKRKGQKKKGIECGGVEKEKENEWKGVK